MSVLFRRRALALSLSFILYGFVCVSPSYAAKNSARASRANCQKFCHSSSFLRKPDLLQYDGAVIKYFKMVRGNKSVTFEDMDVDSFVQTKDQLSFKVKAARMTSSLKIKNDNQKPKDSKDSKSKKNNSKNNSKKAKDSKSKNADTDQSLKYIFQDLEMNYGIDFSKGLPLGRAEILADEASVITKNLKLLISGLETHYDMSLQNDKVSSNLSWHANDIDNDKYPLGPATLKLKITNVNFLALHKLYNEFLLSFVDVKLDNGVSNKPTRKKLTKNQRLKFKRLFYQMAKYGFNINLSQLQAEAKDGELRMHGKWSVPPYRTGSSRQRWSKLWRGSNLDVSVEITKKLLEKWVLQAMKISQEKKAKSAAKRGLKQPKTQTQPPSLAQVQTILLVAEKSGFLHESGDRYIIHCVYEDSVWKLNDKVFKPRRNGWAPTMPVFAGLGW